MTESRKKVQIEYHVYVYDGIKYTHKYLELS